MSVCCEMMRSQVEHECEEHSTFECPDKLVSYVTDGTIGRGLGLLIHDGGTSYIAINYCPWCGSDVRDPRRRGKSDGGQATAGRAGREGGESA